jgi:hypothetical protein
MASNSHIRRRLEKMPTLVKAYEHWPRVRQADSPDAYVRRILLNEALIENETWLPRTKSLLNKVNDVRIPAGFKQVPAPQ